MKLKMVEELLKLRLHLCNVILLCKGARSFARPSWLSPCPKYQELLCCHHRQEQEHPKTPLPSPQGAAQPMTGAARGSQHHGDQAQKAPASAPKKASSSGSASLLRELTKKLLKNLFKITYSLLEGLLSSLQKWNEIPQHVQHFSCSYFLSFSSLIEND